MRVRRILLNWDIGSFLTSKRVEAGDVNRNWVVTTTEGKYVLRRVAPYRTVKDLLFELRYLTHLRDLGFRYQVPVPLITKNGKSFVSFDGVNCWLYRYIEGNLLKIFGRAEIIEIAKMMAEYHSLIEHSNLDNGRRYGNLFNWEVVLRELSTFLSGATRKRHLDSGDRVFIEQVAVIIPLLRGLRERGSPSLKRYPLHRDINPENLVWAGGGLVGIIDFENVGIYNEPVIKDIAILFQNLRRQGGLELDLYLAKEFLEAYTRHHCLKKGEICLIPDLMIAGFAEDFDYAYWMHENDPQRAKRSRLKLYSRAAQWVSENKGEILACLLDVKK